MSKVITQNDLTDIVQSALAVSKSSVDLVNGIAGNVDKIKTISASKLKSAVETTELTISNLTKLVESLMNQKMFEDENVKALLESKGEETRLVKVLNAMIDMISFIPKAMDNLSKIDLGFITMIKLKVKLAKLPLVLKSIILSLKDGMLKLAQDKEIRELSEYLTSTETTIKQVNKNTMTGGDMSIDKTTKKRGVIDIMLDMMKLFGDLARLGDSKWGTKNRINAYLFIRSITSIMSAVFNRMVKMSKKIDNKELDSIGAKVSGLKDIIDNIQAIVDELIPLGLKSVLLKSLILPLTWGLNSIQTVITLVKSIKVGRVNPSAFEKIIDLIKSFNMLMSDVVSLAWKAPIVLIAIKSILGSIQAIQIIITKITSIKISRILTSIEEIDAISRLISRIGWLMMKVVFIAPLAAAAAFACAAIALSFVVIAPVLIMVIGVLSLIALVIRNTRIGRSMRIISLTVWGMGLIMLSLVMFSLTCLALTETASAIDFNLFFEILIHFTVATAILWILGLAIGSVAIYFAIGLGVMLATILGMCIIVGALLLFVSVIKAISIVAADINWENITDIFAGLGQVLTAVSSFLGEAYLKMPLVLAMIPLLISFNLMFVNLLAIAGILKAISNMNLDNAAIATGVDTIMGSVKTVVDGVDGMDISRKEGTAARRTVRRVRRIVNQMKELAESLMGIQSIKLDQNVILKTIDDVFAVIFAIEEKITSIHSNITYEEGTDAEGNETIIEKIVRKTRKEKRHERQDARHAKRMLGRVDAILEEISSIIVGLKSIQDIQINPQDIDAGLEKIFKCIGYVEGKIKDMNTATFSIGSKSINYRKDWLERVKDRKAAKHTDKVMGRVDSILNEIASIVESINAIKDVKIDDQVEANVTNILGATNKIAKLIMDNEVEGTKIKYNSKDFRTKVDYLKNIGEVIKSLVLPQQDFENASKLIDQNIQFLDKVDKSKVENLKTAANMFEKMAQFSESINGNFEGLADTLNEKIAPLMEELKELLEGVQDKVEETGANVSKAAYNSGKNLSEPEMQAQVNSENPKAEAEEKARIVQQRMEEQARAQTSAITSKLDELIELMRSGMVQVRTV